MNQWEFLTSWRGVSLFATLVNLGAFLSMILGLSSTNMLLAIIVYSVSIGALILNALFNEGTTA